MTATGDATICVRNMILNQGPIDMHIRVYHYVETNTAKKLNVLVVTKLGLAVR